MERTQWTVGPQVFEFEPPDVFHTYLNARFQISEVKELHKIVTQEVFPKVGKVFHVVHLLPKAAGFTPEARKYAGSLPVDVFKAMLIVGGSPVARAAIAIVSRASEVLGISRGLPMKMFKTEEEAHAYIKEFRAAEQAKSDSPGVDVGRSGA